MRPCLQLSTLLLVSACIGIAGCGGSSTSTTVIPPVTTYSGVTFSGTVKAGVQPLAGATVQLYQAGTAGSGSAPTTLLSGALTTDATGSFTVPAGYTCTTGASQIYVVARGGGIGSAAANSAIALLSTLGACNQVTASSHIVVNEVTTVANAWALAQFLATGGNIGASATNATGLANAVATAANLANPATGTAPGASFPTGGTSPAPRLNTLANLLNTCTSAASGSSACTALLSTSQNTLDAALRIVLSPGSNVASLYAQSKASTAFAPVLSAAPSDWTLYVAYTGGAMSEPTALAVDSKGNVWVVSYPGSVTELSPVGQFQFPTGITGSGLEDIYGVAIDAQNNVWVPNQQSASGINNGRGSVTVLNSSGQPLSGSTGYIAGGLAYPTAIAIDTDGSAWVVNNFNSSVTKLSSTGQSLTGTSGIVSNAFDYPVAVAIDASHNAWVGGANGTAVSEASSDGSKITSYPCCNELAGLAVDQTGNVWIANYGLGNISEVSSTGTVLSGGGYTANGALLGPQGMAIDGSGNVWISSFRAGSIAELAGAKAANPGQSLSPATGWAPEAALSGAYAVAIDSAGNLWVTNFYANAVTEFVGIAAPVKTPLNGTPQAP